MSPVSGAALLGGVLKKQPPTDERTNPIGLLHYARAYAEAGVHLKGAKLTEGHRDAPVDFLLMHSIELYLKSFLRLRGFAVKQLWGHDFAWLAKEAEAHGLTFDDEDRNVIEVMVHTDAWSRARYIKTGFTVKATPEAFIRTCLSFDRSVSDALEKEGHHVRPIA